MQILVNFNHVAFGKYPRSKTEKRTPRASRVQEHNLDSNKEAHACNTNVQANTKYSDGAQRTRKHGLKKANAKNIDKSIKPRQIRQILEIKLKKATHPQSGILSKKKSPL